jgi:YD repeat-containing protein
VSYTYLGLASFVQLTYPEPSILWDLNSGGDPANPYLGLDRFGRVIDCSWVETATSGELEGVEYGYDRNGSRLWRHNTVAPAGGNDELYTYDDLQRLTDMARGNLASGDTAIDDLSLSQDWTLDATGNWSEFVNTDAVTPANNLDQSRTSNTVNEITDITRSYGPDWVTPAYDAAGNMTTVPSGLDPTTSFTGTYDAWNRLVALSNDSGEVAAYAYDGLNRRIQKTIGSDVRDYFYTSQWQSIEEWLNSSLDRQFVWGQRYIDDLVLRDRFSSGTERLYALQDANWNVTATCDTSGAVQERYRYTAYYYSAELVFFLAAVGGRITEG